jgi:hypothetical protein
MGVRSIDATLETDHEASNTFALCLPNVNKPSDPVLSFYQEINSSYPANPTNIHT